mmetsp:Transcript_38865/g.83722  ORF Transcript_38865/g.83722 Transcript_38865/m.83722 type:complete len:241 (-) Transcript_38865:1591-2313(-)
MPHLLNRSPVVSPEQLRYRRLHLLPSHPRVKHVHRFINAHHPIIVVVVNQKLDHVVKLGRLETRCVAYIPFEVQVKLIPVDNPVELLVYLPHHILDLSLRRSLPQGSQLGRRVLRSNVLHRATAHVRQLSFQLGFFVLQSDHSLFLILLADGYTTMVRGGCGEKEVSLAHGAREGSVVFCEGVSDDAESFHCMGLFGEVTQLFIYSFEFFQLLRSDWVVGRAIWRPHFALVFQNCSVNMN